VAVSHLDKVYWPADGLTKNDLLGYYRQVAPVLLPYCAGRPVTVRIYPNGMTGFSYYRRDRPDKAPDWLRAVSYKLETTGTVSQMMLVEDSAGLIWLANQGAIEFHIWGARVPDLAGPDMAIIDLDPGDETEFPQVLQAALHVRDLLARAGLRGYAKTSGGRGMHVFLPLEPGHSFAGVRDWVKTAAEELAAAHPDLIEVAHGATHTGGKVTIDHAQNSVGRNTAAPYTLRARPGAPVSAPVAWDEVEEGRMRPEDFSLRTIFERLARAGDLFAPVLLGGQRLPEQRAA
jgi:bifunctional non-homologous end joining protein LigD